jgi:hypothetical protein
MDAVGTARDGSFCCDFPAAMGELRFAERAPQSGTLKVIPSGFHGAGEPRS